MKTERKLNFIIVILFIAAITLPLIFADFQGGKISTAENRYLATFPKIVENGELVFRPSEFDNWINDNIGGRSLATKINTIANYKLFNLSAKETDMIGKENWIYYYTQNILDDFTGSNLLSEKSLATIADNINVIGEYLAEKDITLLMVVAPDKKTVYPEYYPNGIKPSKGLRRLQQLEQYVNANSVIPFYSLENVLMANKSLGYLYSQRIDDAHWNYLGGYVGYMDIISKLNGMGVSVSCVPLSESTISIEEYHSVFNDAVPISEPWYTITNEKSSTVHLNREHLDQFPFMTYNKDSDNYKRYYTNDDASLPSLLFIGDSYSQKLFEFIPQSFSRVMFAHSADLAMLPRILDIESFDIVIIESAERMLDYEFTLLESCADNIERHVDATALAKMIENIRICEYTEWGYNYIDYCGYFGTESNTITVIASEATSFMEGWALDPLALSTAGSVIVQVGDQYYTAEYGKERTSVVDYFQNEAYLNSGYTISLNTQELLDAGVVVIHVISADGSYQYPPCIYTVHAQ